PDAYISRANRSLCPVQHRGAAAVAAAGPGCNQPRSCAFADQVAFELGQGREHMEDQLAARGGGINRLLQPPEADATVGLPSDRVDQVAQGAAEAVQLPDHQSVAGAQLVQDLLEDGPVGAGAAGGLG